MIYMNQNFMKEKPVFPLVLSMSLPMVLSMLVNSLYNIVDSYFIAKISEEAMTALSLVYPVQILVNSVAVGFGIGINAVAAYYLGAQEKDKADNAVSLGLLFSILHGALLTVLCLAGISHFLSVFTENETIIGYGRDYSYIVFLFSLPLMIGITFEKIFQAEGQMTVSMISMLCGCMINIILDPVMIFGAGFIPAMGIKGAAIATGIGQVVSLIIYLVIYFKKPLPLKLKFRRKMMDGKLCRQIYAVGIPAAFNMALPSVLITVLNGILASFSQVYVLVLGIYFKLQTFIYLTANGIVQGIRPIIGYNYGAGEYGRVRKIFQAALACTGVVMAVGTVICFTSANHLMALFTENRDTIQTGQTALRIISLGFIVSSVSVISCGALEGLGKGLPSLTISLMRYIVIIIPAAFLLSRIFGAVGVWHAFWAAEGITAVAALIIYKKTVLKAVK